MTPSTDTADPRILSAEEIALIGTRLDARGAMDPDLADDLTALLAYSAALLERIEALEGENADLRAQLAAAKEVIQSYLSMMAEWQTETTHYLCDRHTAESYINCVIYMQDGPEQRELDQRAQATLSGAPR